MNTAILPLAITMFVFGVLVATAIGVMALRTGLLVILFTPSDLIVMATVATNLAHEGDSLTAAVPFVPLTTAVAALPLPGYLIFHRRAVVAMPKLREWTNSNSWLVNIIVCVIFIVLIV